MNRQKLKIELEKQGIPKNWYSLYGEKIPDSYVLELSYKWEIFYFGEKGKIEDIASFCNENEACQYFYNLMIDSKKKMSKYFEQVKNPSPQIKIGQNNRIFVVSDTGEINVQQK
jgi:hypothetical protein